jgi:hypothetical protein
LGSTTFEKPSDNQVKKEDIPETTTTTTFEIIPDSKYQKLADYKTKPAKVSNGVLKKKCKGSSVPYYEPERVLGPRLISRTSAPQYSFGLKLDKSQFKTSTSANSTLKDAKYFGNDLNLFKKYLLPNEQSPGPIYDITMSTNAVKKRSPAFSIRSKNNSEC